MVPTSLLLTALFATTASSPDLHLPLHLRIEAALPEETLETLVREVEDVFAPLGVRLQMVGPETPDARLAATIVVRAQPVRPRIAGCSRDRHDHRLALTVLPSRRIVLWTDQVARAARGKWDSAVPPRLDGRQMGRALGRVLAHELGHLVLGFTRHRSSGLMRAHFRKGDLIGKRRKSFAIPEEDVERAHRRLARLLGVIGAPSPAAER